MELDQLKPIGVWGEIWGNEQYLTNMTPVFQDAESIPYTTSAAAGPWSSKDLRNIRGQEDYFFDYPELEGLSRAELQESWYLWTVGPQLQSSLLASGIDWREYLPEPYAIGELHGFPNFAATTEQADQLRGALLQELDATWVPVLQNLDLKSEVADRAISIARKLDYDARRWDRLSYYYLTGDDRMLSRELRFQKLRKWREDSHSDRDWARKRIEKHLRDLRSASSAPEGN